MAPGGRAIPEARLALHTAKFLFPCDRLRLPVLCRVQKWPSLYCSIPTGTTIPTLTVLPCCLICAHVYKVRKRAIVMVHACVCVHVYWGKKVSKKKG